MGDTEMGAKWWIRYVIVPLIGGGGVVALLIAMISHSNRPVPVNPVGNAVQEQHPNTPNESPKAQPHLEFLVQEEDTPPKRTKLGEYHMDSRIPPNWVDRLDLPSERGMVLFKWKVPKQDGQLFFVVETVGGQKRWPVEAEGTEELPVPENSAFSLQDNSGVLKTIRVHVFSAADPHVK